MQETWHPKDIDFTCYKTLLTKSSTRLPVEPMSLEWPVALPAGSDQYSPSSSHEDPGGEHPGDALPASPHLRWRRDAIQPPQVQQDGACRNTCGHFPDGGLRCVTWNTGCLIGSVFSSQRNRELKLNYFGRLTRTTKLSVSRRYTGRMHSSRLFKCGPRNSDYLVRSFLAVRMQGIGKMHPQGTLA